jgi:serine/threonine protein phosphatase 1
MGARVIAIGDIHGCLAALRGLLRELAPTCDDTLITLGDYVSRGPDGRGVLDELAGLKGRCNLVPLLGNHEEMLLSNRAARTAVPGYPLRDPESQFEYFDDRHFEWLQACPLYYETEHHFFVHANYQPQVDLAAQDRYTLLWLSLHQSMPKPIAQARWPSWDTLRNATGRSSTCRT